MNTKHLSLWATLLFAFAFLLSSCQQDLEETSPAQPLDKGTSTNQIQADLLAVINVGDGSTVSFYEFAPGEVAIRQAQLSAPKPGQPNARVMASVSRHLDQLSQKRQSLVEIYKALADRPDPNALNRLAQAQERLTVAQAASQRESSPGPVADNEPKSGAGGRVAATGCTPDYYNDNYGAQWFINNYVNENRFRRHQTNVPGASFKLVDQSWAKVCAMAPDFETGIHFSGQRIEGRGWFTSGKWVKRWGFDIPPRGVECWYINSTKTYFVKAVGYDPCQRVHLGVCSDGL